ncbi:MAG: tetratricopeptide repeat protein, partial [Pseudomonadota bacterium]
EGAVQRTAGRVRIQAALINVRTDETLWSESFTEPARDAFALQDDITRRIAAALRVTIGEDGEARIEQVFKATDNEAAYDKFLLGEHLWHLRGEDNIRQAIGHLEEAIAMEPNFGRAQALLAMAHITLQSYAAVDSLEAWEALRDTHVAAARTYAERALAIDPALVDPYTALGDLTRVENRWQDAEAYYLRALELDPNDATANLWYGEFLEDVGRTTEAYSATRKTLDVDPFSPGANAMLAGLLMADKECEALAAPADRATTLGHDFGAFSRMLCDMAIGDWQSAATRAESTLPDNAPPDAVAWVDNLKAVAAATTEAQSAEAAQPVLAFLSEFAGNDAGASVTLIHMGFADEVVELLIQESASWGGLSRVFWGVSGETIRAHPRFGELLELSGLADYYQSTGLLPDPCTAEPAEAFCSALDAT